MDKEAIDWGSVRLAIIIPLVALMIGVIIGRASAETEYIYEKHVPDRVYNIQKDGSMLQYDYCEGCNDRPATKDEIEAFWKKAHPEWYK